MGQIEIRKYLSPHSALWFTLTALIAGRQSIHLRENWESMTDMLVKEAEREGERCPSHSGLWAHARSIDRRNTFHLQEVSDSMMRRHFSRSRPGEREISEKLIAVRAHGGDAKEKSDCTGGAGVRCIFFFLSRSPLLHPSMISRIAGTHGYCTHKNAEHKNIFVVATGTTLIKTQIKTSWKHEISTLKADQPPTRSWLS